MRGHVKRVVIEKRYGFIQPDEGGGDLFFHRSALDGDLAFGEGLRWRRVEFDIEPCDDGRVKAANVRLAE